LILLVLLLIKHAFADWHPFQTMWMVRGKRRSGLGFVVPLCAHSLTHAVFTIIAVSFWYGTRNEFAQYKLCMLAGLFDFCAHFTFDRSKAILERLSNNRKYRIFLVLVDQILHCGTYIAITLYLTS
jgi:hypothetical protein